MGTAHKNFRFYHQQELRRHYFDAEVRAPNTSCPLWLKAKGLRVTMLIYKICVQDGKIFNNTRTEELGKGCFWKEVLDLKRGIVHPWFVCYIQYQSRPQIFS